MAVPKQKVSRSRTRSRRAQWKARSVQLMNCPNRACRELKPLHVACPVCGQYNGRQVVEPE